MNLQPRSGDTTLATGVRACSPKDEIVKPLLFPSSQRRGGRDLNKNIAEGILMMERTGWSETILTTPSAPSAVASHRFLDAQPPLLQRRGIAASRNTSVTLDHECTNGPGFFKYSFLILSADQ